jgi:hypothetical protein
MNHSSYGNGVYITSSAKLEEPSNSRQGPLVFTCPATGLNVQRQLDDDQAASEAKMRRSPAPLSRVARYQPKTGKPPGPRRRVWQPGGLASGLKDFCGSLRRWIWEDRQIGCWIRSGHRVLAADRDHRRPNRVP